MNGTYTGNAKLFVIAIVVLIGMAMAFVLGIEYTGGIDESSTPLITTVLGFVSLSVVALFAALNASKSRESQERVEDKVDTLMNGAGDEKLRNAIRAVLHEELPQALDDAVARVLRAPKLRDRT